MKIEINMNELTGAQRRHVADFVTNWPEAAQNLPRVSATEPTKPPVLETVEPVDINGTTWNHLIHASTKTFVADGTWKLRRGTTADDVKLVKAIETMVTPLSPYIEELSFTSLISAASDAILEGKLTQDQVVTACHKIGISEFALLSSRPDLLPAFAAEMRALGVVI